VPKRRETPRRSWARLTSRPRLLGYWLRRPEPSLVASAAFVALFILIAVGAGQPVALVGAAACALAGVFIWRTRKVSRDNAERWRLRRPDAF
jgi:hypothetical protein